MELRDLVADMAMRFINVEKNQYVQIRNLKQQIQDINNNYEILKAKPHIFVQNIFLYFLSMGAFMLLFYIARKIYPQVQEAMNAYGRENPSIVYVMTVVTLLFPIIVLILNVIRGKRKQKKRIRQADEWWEQVGRAKVVEINKAIDALRAEAYNYLSANELYDLFVARGWANSKDCDGVYDVTVRYNLTSIQQAFSVYQEVLTQRYEHEQDRYRQQQILEAIEENNQYQAELAEQGRRAEFDRSVIELQLFEMKNRH